jgi:hypothetical protein
VLSLAAPSYAPAGRHLIATTAPAEAGLDEPAVRRHLVHLYGRPADRKLGANQDRARRTRPGHRAASPGTSGQGTAETGNRTVLMSEGAWSGPLLGLWCLAARREPAATTDPPRSLTWRIWAVSHP